jgi:hypothetical protein
MLLLVLLLLLTFMLLICILCRAVALDFNIELLSAEMA